MYREANSVADILEKSGQQEWSNNFGKLGICRKTLLVLTD